MHSTGSIWHATADLPEYPPLSGHARTDVCVIGAGIGGLTAAYLLLRAGKRVTVLEAEQIGNGQTCQTTAHFFPPDERYHLVARKFGIAAAALLAKAYREATDLVESIVRAEGIDCRFKRLDGYLIAQVRGQDDILAQELATTRALGLETERLGQVPSLVYDTGPAVRFAHCAQFHPLRYLAGLARAIERLGGTICGHTRALGIVREDGSQRVSTAGGDVLAHQVVVATHTPFNDRVVMHTKQAGYTTYVIGVRVKKGDVPPMLLWDTGAPYYYVRLADIDDGDEDILIVGGQDHKTGQDGRPQHRWQELEMWARNRFPRLGQVAYRWSGQVMEPADGLPYLGRNPLDNDDSYILTGDSGNGMTHCTAGALLVRDLITGAANPWSTLFAPNRKPVHGLGDFVTEQANVMQQYADWVGATEVSSPEHIAPGEGALIRRGLTLYAVHRPEQGALEVLAARCTHLGCAVHWNSAEKSWDCPCHASRFATNGEVLHGPARAPLAAAHLPPD